VLRIFANIITNLVTHKDGAKLKLLFKKLSQMFANSVTNLVARKDGAKLKLLLKIQRILYIFKAHCSINF
jgi:hypothetical protein